jgi:hypothetical protein
MTQRVNYAQQTPVLFKKFRAELNDQSLVPGDNPRIAPASFEEWLSQVGW